MDIPPININADFSKQNDKSKKLKQKGGSGNTIIAPSGDVTVNQGLGTDQLNESMQLFFDNVLPLLREVAKNQAKEEAEKWGKKLQEAIVVNAERIDVNKLSEPDVQFLLSDSFKNVGRRGDKANPDLLVKMIIERISNDHSELQELVVAQAAEVIPALTSTHLNILTFLCFLNHTSLKKLNHLSELEFSWKLIHDVFKDLSISGWNLQYLEVSKCVQINDLGNYDFENIFKRKYPETIGELSNKEIKEQIESTTYLKKVCKIYKNNDMTARTRLTVLGTFIGALNLSRYSSKIVDFENFIK